jgi:YtcA-like protein
MHLAPSVDILGSFFPAWLISIVAGIVLTVVARQGLVAARMTHHVEPAGVVYPSLACLLTFATWLLVFAS